MFMYSVLFSKSQKSIPPFDDNMKKNLIVEMKTVFVKSK